MKRILTTVLVLIVAAVSLAAKKDKGNPIATISQDPGLCTIIHRWGFIGDSLCSGEHEFIGSDGGRGYDDIFEYSWGQRICAACGTEGDNYSQGGETASGWIEHFWEHPANRNGNIDAKADLKQAYIIALGCNDKHCKVPAGDPYADIDTEDYTKNAPTFIGNYAGIIQRVKSLQPDAKFFVVTMPDDYAEESYNVVIRKLPEIFENLYVLDIAKYGPSYKDPDFRSKYFLYGHMNAAGYQFTAWMFMTYINWIIENDMEAFSHIAFMK
ncbi:MAG: SGNH/GDSL hydrolase family protein [Bacteroidales bacterium]|nr:SGNH/GDSL hydrolase family protein [Bacteroidales bacterium]